LLLVSVKWTDSFLLMVSMASDSYTMPTFIVNDLYYFHLWVAICGTEENEGHDMSRHIV